MHTPAGFSWYNVQGTVDRSAPETSSISTSTPLILVETRNLSALFPQLQDGIQEVRLIITARYLCGYAWFPIGAPHLFLLLHQFYFVWYHLSLPIYTCFYLTHSHQVTNFLTHITLSSFKLGTCSHMVSFT